MLFYLLDIVYWVEISLSQVDKSQYFSLHIYKVVYFFTSERQYGNELNVHGTIVEI